MRQKDNLMGGCASKNGMHCSGVDFKRGEEESKKISILNTVEGGSLTVKEGPLASLGRLRERNERRGVIVRNGKVEVSDVEKERGYLSNQDDQVLVGYTRYTV